VENGGKYFNYTYLTGQGPVGQALGSQVSINSGKPFNQKSNNELLKRSLSSYVCRLVSSLFGLLVT